MAWKRSSVRSRPGPPTYLNLSERVPARREGRRFDQVHQSPMPAVYILQSETAQRFYIGSAADPVARLAEHQRGQTISTRNRGPWVLVHQKSLQR